MAPWRPLIGNRLLVKTDPGHHAAYEAITFGHGEEGVDHPAVHQPEVAGVERNGDVREAIHESIEGAGRPTFERSLAAASDAHAVGDIGAVVPEIEHVGDNLGRILQIGVDHDDSVPRGMLQACGNGDLVAKVARQDEHPYAHISLPDLAQKFQRGVAAAVVDVDDLEVEFGDCVNGPDETTVHLANDLFLVEAGDDDGQGAPWAALMNRGGAVLIWVKRCARSVSWHLTAPLRNEGKFCLHECDTCKCMDGLSAHPSQRTSR